MSKQSVRHAVLESEERSLETVTCANCGFKYPGLLGPECPNCGHVNYVETLENPLRTYNRINARVIVTVRRKGKFFDFDLYNMPSAGVLSEVVRRIMSENMTKVDIDNADVEFVRLNPKRS